MTRKADYAGSPAWSPDGTTIAFTLSNHVDDSYGADSAIYTMDPAGHRRRLTPPGVTGRPVWSPDSSEIAFVEYGNGIFIIGRDGRNLRHVGPTDAEGVTWSPDGGRFAFTRLEPGSGRDDQSPNFGLYVMSRDGSQVKRIASSLFDVWENEWSPDGMWIAFAGVTAIEAPECPARSSAIFIIHPDDTSLRRVSPCWPNVQSPSWSPDGSRIAFLGDEQIPSRSVNKKGLVVVDPAVFTSSIYTVRADGTELRRLKGRAESGLTWQPS